MTSILDHHFQIDYSIRVIPKLIIDLSSLKMSTEEKAPLTEYPKQQQDEGEEKPSQKREISIPDCTVHSVVVYPDRAEVGMNVLNYVIS